MTVAQTSLEAYHQLPSLGDKQAVILGMIAFHGPISDNQLANISGWPKNEITPRRGELREMGYIKQVGEQLSAKHRREAVWAVVE